MQKSYEMCHKNRINYFKHRIYHSQTLKIAGVMRLVRARSTLPDLDKNIYQRGSQVILKLMILKKIRRKFSIENPMKILKNRKIENFSKNRKIEKLKIFNENFQKSKNRKILSFRKFSGNFRPNFFQNRQFQNDLAPSLINIFI